MTYFRLICMYIYCWITFEVAAVKGGAKFADCWVAISMIMHHNLLVYYIQFHEYAK